MKIGLASDHQGFSIKESLKKHFKKEDYQVVDFGTESEEATDYPQFAFAASEKVASLELDFAILICGTGIGMSMASNKVKGVRCAKVDNLREAVLAKTHNNANVLAFSSEQGFSKIKKFLDVFMASTYSYDDRHNRRLEAIVKYENEH